MPSEGCTKDHALELKDRSDQQRLAYLQIHSWRVFLRLPATDSYVEQSDRSYSARQMKALR